jgi:two-component system OmpR family sensor kinase
MSSIQRKLLIWLLGGILLATGFAGLAIYQTARNEANELFDYQLQQTAVSLPAHPDESVAYQNETFEEDIIVQVWTPHNRLVYTSNHEFALPLYKQQGFRTITAFDENWRVYTENRRTNIIQTAQPMRVREYLAANLAIRSLAPLLLLIPVMLILASIIVRRNLLPLQAMTRALQQRTAFDLQPLPEQNLPAELTTITRALNDLLARLDKSQSAQRAFIADAAHELRSPLTALKLQLQLAERAKTETQRTQAIAKLGERLERAIHLTMQMLTLARQEASGNHPENRPIKLGELLQRIQADYSTLASNRQISLTTDIPQPDIELQGNPDNLTILLKNLVENALHYTPDGGEIRLQTCQEQGQAILRVTDTGPGIPIEERQRVFDRFYRIPGNVLPGTGLGLSIVQNIAEQHGASIQLLDNPAGHGLQISVIFPSATANKN